MFRYLCTFFLLIIGSNILAQNVRFGNIPRHLQFLARDAQDSSLITVSGSLDSPGYDSVYLVLYKSAGGVSNKLRTTSSGRLAYGAGSAPFSLNTKIHAELAEYKIDIMAAPQGLPAASHVLLKTVDSLVSGDFYVIAGQSNSHPADVAATYRDQYCRTLGIQTEGENYSGYNPADTLWGYANGDGFGGTFSGPYLVGVWGIRLMQYIRDSVRIPVCIINGGAGGSNIQMNLPTGNRTDFGTIYGRLLYRIQKAGLQNSIRAMFWYQGESDILTDTSVYSQRFAELRAAWKADYGPVSKIYLPQIHPGCPYIGGGLIREFQRTINKRYPEIQPMSTISLPDHDGCHYSKNAYDLFAYQVFRVIARDFYGSTNTAEIEAPNILHAYYPNKNKTRIRLLFEKTNALSLTSMPGRNISDYFYLDKDTGRVIRTEAQNATVTLTVADTGTASTITYLPDTFYNRTDSYYEGPFIVNANGIGAYTFYGKKIENNTAFQRPEAAFGFDQRGAKPRVPIQLSDSSLEWPTQYFWTAFGGTMSSEFVANPTVTFASPGTYTIRLIVYNNLGGDTLVKTIMVSEDGNIFKGGQGRGDAMAQLINQALPVELLSFEATESNCAALLKWETARERNIATFEIQKSIDGSAFTTSGNLAPNGNTAGFYQIVLPQSETSTYYRLKIIDRDGKFSYSNIGVLKLTCDLNADVFTVSPNPARNVSKLTVNYTSTDDKGKATISLWNASGREIKNIPVNIKKGQNRFNLPLPSLSQGLYFIRLITQSGLTRSYKIMVTAN